MSGSVYKDPRNTRKPWVVQYATPDGRRPTKAFRRKQDANDFLLGKLREVRDGDWVSPDAGRVTLAEYAETFIRTRAVRETTRDRYRRELSCIDGIKDLALSALSPSILEDWQAALLRTRKPSTVNTYRNTVNTMLRRAVRDQRIKVNPLDGVRKPEVVRGKVTPMEHETVHHIHTHLNERYRAAVALGAACGLRSGEAFGLLVDRVDFLRRRITIDRTLIYIKGEGFMLGPPKTATSERTAPLPDFVAVELAGHIRRWGTGSVFDSVTGRDVDGLIFLTNRGTPVSKSVLADCWRRVGPAGSRFHDLRHHFASVHIQGGASVKELQALMGHKNASETLDTYSHLWPNSEDRARQRIEAAWLEFGAGGAGGLDMGVQS